MKMNTESGWSILTAILFCLGIVVPGARAADTLELSVREAVGMALENNLGLRLDRQDIQSAEGRLETEHGTFDTILSAEAQTSESRSENTSLLSSKDTVELDQTDWRASVSKTFSTGTNLLLAWDNARSETNTAVAGSGTSTTVATLDPAYSSSLNLSLIQPLLKGRGTERQTLGIRAAEEGLQAARFQVDDTAAQLAADVKKAYWQLSLSLEDIEVRRLSLELAQKLLDETRAKIDAGVLAPVDVYQPEAEVARREELLIRSQKGVADAEDSLKVLLNLKDWAGEVRLTDKPTPGMPEPVMEEIVRAALESRKDIKAAEARLVSSRWIRERAEDAVRPSLNLVGGAGISGLDDSYSGALDDYTGESYYNWSVGLQFSVPFENRAARGEVIRVRSEEEKAALQLDLLRQNVTVEARSAVRNAETAGKALVAAQKSSLAFKKRLETEQARFEVGLSTANDVLQAQDEYAQALISEKSALIGLENAMADLDRVQGALSLGDRESGRQL